MRVQKLFALAFLAFGVQKSPVFAQKNLVSTLKLTDGRSILRAQHSRHAGQWWQTLTFEQSTDLYKNGKIDTTETWFEALQMPDKLRIDFGSIGSGDAAIWRGDSLFLFEKGKPKAALRRANELIFLLGGMYFEPFDSVCQKMEKLGIDLRASDPDAMWNGKKAPRIGSEDGGGSAIWLDEHRLLPVRIVQTKNGQKHEVRIDLRVPLSKGFSEAKITFLIDGQVQQVERYNELRAEKPLDPGIFDPRFFGLFRWEK